MTSHSNSTTGVHWSIPDPYDGTPVLLTPAAARKRCEALVRELKTPAFGSMTHSQIAELLGWGADISRVSKLVNGRYGGGYEQTVHIIAKLSPLMMNAGTLGLPF